LPRYVCITKSSIEKSSLELSSSSFSAGAVTFEGSTVCDGALMAKSIETTFDDTFEAELPEAASSAEVSSAKAAAGTVVSAVSLLNSGVA